MSTDINKKSGIVRRFFRRLWRSLVAFNTIVFGLIAVCIIAALLFAVFGGKDVDIPEGGKKPWLKTCLMR